MNINLKNFKNSRFFKRDDKLDYLIEHGGRFLSPREVRLVVLAAIDAGYETLHDVPDEFVDNILTKKEPEHVCEVEQTEIAFD